MQRKPKGKNSCKISGCRTVWSKSSLKKINVMDVRGKEKESASGKSCYLISFLSSSSAA